MKLYLETLGCARNQVDSEVLSGQLALDGWEMVEEPESADAIVVNTCGFVGDAIDASVDAILELSEHKKGGNCRYLVVGGCLPERFQEDIATSLPEVDYFAGTGAYDTIRARLFPLLSGAVPEGETQVFPDPESLPLHHADMARHLEDPVSAYLKIAEGCTRRCTYCIIPKLRGNQRSRELRDLTAEVRKLLARGIKEIVLVAQETTDWGHDLSPRQHVADLVAAVSDVVGDAGWVRFLYGHPESLDDRLLDVVGSRKNVCSYFDLPIQHAADGVLKKMGRHYTRAALLELFGKIRTKVPDAVLRTTLITGFPGETEEDVVELMEFMETVRFDHLGVFIYSDMDDLPSHNLPNHVDADLAQERYDSLMAHQAQISFETNQKRLGATFKVLIENIPEEGLAEGRTMYQAPEVDGITYVDGADLHVGDVVEVEITDAHDYDLVGDRLA